MSTQNNQIQLARTGKLENRFVLYYHCDPEWSPAHLESHTACTELGEVREQHEMCREKAREGNIVFYPSPFPRKVGTSQTVTHY